MHAQILTIDLGNSRAKLALFERAEARYRFSDETIFETSATLAREVDEFLQRNGRILKVLLASVGPIEIENELAVLLQRRFGAEFQRNPTVLMRVDYQPEQALGRDRLYAALGAVSYPHSNSAAFVVDSGTALTVDFVTQQSVPLFHGGAIAPGPSLMASALHRHTARLPLVEPREGVDALGRDTPSAVRAGVVVGFRGIASELVKQIAAEVHAAAAVPVVVTGGARGLLLRPESCFGTRPVVEEPYLVHMGLLASLWNQL